MKVRERQCPGCGQPALRRIERTGFLRTHIYPMFGYYPWECPQCRRKLLLPNRGNPVDSDPAPLFEQRAEAPSKSARRAIPVHGER